MLITKIQVTNRSKNLFQMLSLYIKIIVNKDLLFLRNSNIEQNHLI